MNIFVSRHSGVKEWARRQGYEVDKVVYRLDIEDVSSGDTVMGPLSIYKSAEVCERGARLLHLAMQVPRHLRGRNLSADQMETCNARLNELRVERVSG